MKTPQRYGKTPQGYEKHNKVMKNTTYILRIKCPDAYGIVAKVSTSLNDMNIFIMDSSFFSDPETKSYFMRLKIFSSKGEIEFSNFSNSSNRFSILDFTIS